MKNKIEIRKVYARELLKLYARYSSPDDMNHIIAMLSRELDKLNHCGINDAKTSLIQNLFLGGN